MLSISPRMSLTISIMACLAASLKCLVTYMFPRGEEKLPLAVPVQIRHLGVSSLVPVTFFLKWKKCQYLFKIEI